VSLIAIAGVWVYVRERLDESSRAAKVKARAAAANADYTR
jgi:hypothetical protein